MPSMSYSIGILDRHDVGRGLVKPADRRIQRRRLAGSGRPGHEDDAVRLVDQGVEAVERVLRHAEVGELELGQVLFEQTQHDALAVAGRQRRDAHVDRAAADSQRDSPVLRQALLGDVERRHDLDTRHQCRVQCTLGPHDVAQRAVDAEADQRIGLERFDVDVARAVARRLGQQRVDHADDRCVVLGLEQVLDIRDFLHHARDVELALDVANDLLRRAALVAVGLRNRLGELGRLDDDRPHLAREHAHHFIERSERRRIRDPDLSVALALRYQQNRVVASEGVGDEAAGRSHADRPAAAAMVRRRLGRSPSPLAVQWCRPCSGLRYRSKRAPERHRRTAS